jgi:hypothetical protein
MSCTLSKSILIYFCKRRLIYFNFILASVFASLPRTVRGQPIVLGADPKGKTFLYTNGNSVFIRNIEVSLIISYFS